MELLLNLCWLTLALPAMWMWHHEPECVNQSRRFARVLPLVLFGCILLLLFPVVSATDDLQSMRQEMEESSTSRVGKPSSEKMPGWLSKAGAAPALISLPWFCVRHEVCGQVIVVTVRVPDQTFFLQHSSRAPPFACLGAWAEFPA